MMSIFPAGAWLWKCTGFVLPHPDEADGAWRGVDEQPPKFVPPPGSPHAERETLSHIHAHTHINLQQNITHNQKHPNSNVSNSNTKEQTKTQRHMNAKI